ncbi:MgtC/SapB family protein [Novosphingobium lentum]|uniref:MgtC/SapB family protein n=1 Tax=Novosphingobium lentum TaxID=145287 RepID=UPI001FE0BC32|nr:MgtC/SapB family protein [Novosphingobium lentum]
MVPASLTGLIAALLGGLIVGLERGWRQRDARDGTRVSGVRSFGLLGLAGGIAGLLPNVVAAALVLGVAALLAVGYRLSARSDALSATTAIAGILTVAIGLVAVRQSATVALGAAGACFILLSARRSLHGLLKGLTETEIEAVARFLLVALVVLPLLPDAQFGPYDAWNPRKIWMVVVLVAALSFAGYVAARRMGSERGTLVVALAGAIVSSTAVTADLARRLRSESETRGALSAGIALASIVMFVRVQVLAALLVPRALPSLMLAMAPATLVAGGLALLGWWRQRDDRAAPTRIGNPFDFGPALLLALSVAVLSLVARWALARFGDGGIAVVLGLTGMMDVDAAVITLSGMPQTSLGGVQAGLVLSVPVLANTAIKAGMTMVIAPGRAGLAAAIPLLAALAASLAGLALWYWGIVAI